MRTWGTSRAEEELDWACDALLPDATHACFRGVDVAAPPATTFRWLCQLRAAPYSYDWIDNLGRRSPRTLQGLPDPVPGAPFTTSMGRSMGTVLSVTPGEQLTARVAGAVMSYVLVADDAGTRLLLKIVTARYRWLAPVMSVGDLVMARRQLLNFRSLAEQDG